MPNRREKRNKEIIERRQRATAKLVEWSKKSGSPILRGIRTKGGIYVPNFPSLEKVAEEFEKRNNLLLKDVTDYDFERGKILIRPKPLSKGLILIFGEGIVVLSFEELRNGEIRNNGRGLEEVYSERYVMSGMINEQDAELEATISYSRNAIRQKQKAPSQVYPGAYYVPIGVGKFRRHVSRQDKNPLWFLTEQKKER